MQCDAQQAAIENALYRVISFAWPRAGVLTFLATALVALAAFAWMWRSRRREQQALSNGGGSSIYKQRSSIPTPPDMQTPTVRHQVFDDGPALNVRMPQNERPDEQ